MDHTAIKQIQDTAAALEAAKAIAATLEDGSVPIVSLPDNYKIHSLNSYMPLKARFTGTFSTSRFACFVSYHKSKTIDDAAPVFVDPKKMAATAIYDMGNTDYPGHCEHQALLVLERTAEFAAYRKLVERGDVSQRELADWIEDWRDCLSTVDEDGASLSISALIVTVRNITVEAMAKRDSEEGSFSSKKTTLESVEARSAVGKLPKQINFLCIPYNGLPVQSFRFRISIRPTVDKTNFGVHRIQGEVEDEATANNFCDLITKELGSNATVYHGTFAP